MTWFRLSSGLLMSLLCASQALGGGFSHKALSFSQFAHLSRPEQQEYLSLLRAADLEMDLSTPGTRHSALDAFWDTLICSAYASPGDKYCLNLGIVIPMGPGCQEGPDMHNFKTQPMLSPIGDKATTCSKPGEQPCSPFFGIKSDGSLYCTSSNWTPTCDKMSPKNDHSYLDALNECAGPGKGPHSSITRGSNQLSCDGLVGVFKQQSDTIVGNCEPHKKNCGYVRARVDQLVAKLGDVGKKLDGFPALDMGGSGSAGAVNTPSSPKPAIDPAYTDAVNNVDNGNATLALLNPKNPICGDLATTPYSSQTNVGAVDPKYTQPTKSSRYTAIQSDDKNIQTLAQRLAPSSLSPQQKVLAIHDWVASNITYSGDVFRTCMASVGMAQDAQQRNSSAYRDALNACESKVNASAVLNNCGADVNASNVSDIKCQGDSSTGANGTICEGYSTLTVALLRADGVPARVVRGNLHSAGETPGGDVCNPPNHAWVEALLEGKWISMDLTVDSGSVDSVTNPQKFLRRPSRDSLDSGIFLSTHKPCSYPDHSDYSAF